MATIIEFFYQLIEGFAQWPIQDVFIFCIILSTYKRMLSNQNLNSLLCTFLTQINSVDRICGVLFFSDFILVNLVPWSRRE